MSNEDLIRSFYTAFSERDAPRMNACYHPDVTFSDPVFGTLQGDRVLSMWAMLCERADDLEIEFSKVWADGDRGGAHWEARYTFTTRGARSGGPQEKGDRPVLNRIDASFVFQDGKIVRHEDSFDLRRWAGQALGLPGRMLGGTPMFRAKIRATALKGLDSYISRGR